MKFKSFLAIILAELLAFAPVSVPVVYAQTATQLPPGKQCFQATTGVNGMVGTIGAIMAGSGYVNGSYGGVPLTGGSGSNATANITVSGGVVSAVTILNPGIQYVVGDVLSAAAANIGGSGSGFSFPVASTSINSSLAGGSVAYYIPSTLTTKQTWQNSAESVLNQNPVPLDANGCALVYGSGVYRQIVKDSLNNTIWDAITSSSGSGGGGGGTNIGDGLAVGTVLLWTGTATPANYLPTAGQAISRTTYAALMTAITATTSIVCQSGIATITVPTSISDVVPIGTPIEAACFAPGTIVSAKSSGILTLSNSAVITISTSITLFPWGNGDGATTFNVQDYRGRVPAGRDNMNSVVASVLTSTYYLTPGGAGVNPDAINAVAGSQSYVTTVAQVPTITSSGTNSISVLTNATNVVTYTGSFFTPGGASGGGFDFNTSPPAPSQLTSVGSNSISVTSNNTGGSPPFAHPSIQPTLTTDFIVKAFPDINISAASCLQLSDAGTACKANTGTSGHAVPFLDGTNAFTGSDSFTSVAIAGGTITGMPSPVNPSDVATKAYVDTSTIGLIVLPQSGLATATVLPNTPTYANGASGVGATLTAGSNTTLTVDGIVATLNTVVLVKNQASAFQNGIYTVTTAGGGVPWVLTRATYFNQASNMLAGSFTLVTGGSITNQNTAWVLQSTVTTVGTTAVNFNLFELSSNSVTPPQGRLTLISGSPVMSFDVAAASSVYYDTFNGGGQVPYFNGVTDFIDTIPSNEVSTAMVSAASAGQVVSGNVYDVFWVHSGASRICIAMSAAAGGGSGWASDSTADASHTGNTHTSNTIDNLSPVSVAQFGWQIGDLIAGSGIPGATVISAINASGTSITISNPTTTSLTGTTLTVTGGSNVLRGFGYSQLDKVSRSYLTNKNTVTHCFNGATDYGPVSANQGTYLGSIYATANGQTAMQFKPAGANGGTNNVLGLYNAYNRVRTVAISQDSVSSYSYNSATWRHANNNANNRIRFVDGLGQSQIICDTNLAMIDNAAGGGGNFGCILDWVSGAPNIIGANFGTSNAFSGTFYASEPFSPVIGLHEADIVESGSANATTFFGSGFNGVGGGQTQFLRVTLDQ
jgi:hypothetical protein